MSRLNVAVLVCLFGLSASAAWAQREAPPGASDKGAMDRSSKERSIELERIKRAANKPDAPGSSAPTSATLARFEEIKEDFEGFQRLQDEVLKSYMTGKQIDLEKIASNSEQMNRHAARLETNLFPTPDDQRTNKKPKGVKSGDITALAVPQDLKMLIVELDNTLASFVANPMFSNPQVASAADNAKAHGDLKKLILLTAALKSEADKQSGIK